MHPVPEGKTRYGLAGNIAGFVATALLVNGFVFAVRPAEMSSGRPSLLNPPGAVVGLVWTALFVCMAVVRWALQRKANAGRTTEYSLLVFAALCALYPVYTNGLRNLRLRLAANLLLLGATFFLIPAAWRAVGRWSLWLVPIPVWLVYASVVTLKQIGKLP